MSGMIVYWCERELHEERESGEPYEELVPRHEHFPDGPDQLTLVINTCAALKKAGKLFVTSCSHDPTLGGIVRDGRLPNGEPYTWKKRRP